MKKASSIGKVEQGASTFEISRQSCVLSRDENVTVARTIGGLDAPANATANLLKTVSKR